MAVDADIGSVFAPAVSIGGAESYSIQIHSGDIIT